MLLKIRKLYGFSPARNINDQDIGYLMDKKIEVGDAVVGITETWLDVKAEVLFISSDGESGDIRLSDGEEVYVTFDHFMKFI